MIEVKQLFEKRGLKYNISDIEEPKRVSFNNMTEAVKILHKHIENGSKIGILYDVDWDGIISGYILRCFMRDMNCLVKTSLINKGKTHGITDEDINIFNESNLDLVIIPDSSSQLIDKMKKLNTDVIVLDHHEIGKGVTIDKTDNDKAIVIVNSTLDGEYNGDLLETNVGSEFYSAGLLVYEFLRTYEYVSNIGSIIENKKLYELAASTLLSDIIDTRCNRNIWYLKKTFFKAGSGESELMSKINANKTISKSGVLFSIVPTANKAIRADAGLDVVKVVCNEPSLFYNKLGKYDEQQREVINKINCSDYIKELNNICYVNLSELDINSNYSGVVAAKVSEKTGKNAIAFCYLADGTIKGSFRGKSSNEKINYLEIANNCGAVAEGHRNAFGIKFENESQIEIFDRAINNFKCNRIEGNIWIDRVADNSEDSVVISRSDFRKFLNDGELVRIAESNAVSRTDDAIYIYIPLCYIQIKKFYQKLFVYSFEDIEIKAFEEINSNEEYIKVYAEKQGNFIECYKK